MKLNNNFENYKNIVKRESKLLYIRMYIRIYYQ